MIPRSPEGGKKRLLLVDDDPDILGILAEYLGALGHEVRVAASGREALEALRNEPAFEVAVVDWSLPDVSGREVVSAIRSMGGDCVVLVTTGHGKDVVSDAYVGSLVAGILRKPYTLKGLAARISAVRS